MHALGVVDVAGLALVAAPDPDGAVLRTSQRLCSRTSLGFITKTYIRTANQLLASRGELNIHDSRNVALVDVLRPIEIPGIKNIDVVVWTVSITPSVDHT